MIENYPETHQLGKLSIENPVEVAAELDADELDFGVQIAHDGRVWVCINGIAWLRFKPNRNGGDLK